MDNMEEKDFKVLYDLMKENDSRLKRVETALLGDESYKNEGLVHKVADNSNQVEENKSKLDKIYIWSSAIGGVTSLILYIALTILF